MTISIAILIPISMLDVMPIAALTFDEGNNSMTFYYSANP